MSKPLYWVVWVNGEPHRYTQRAAARGFAMLQRALGHSVTIRSVTH